MRLTESMASLGGIGAGGDGGVAFGGNRGGGAGLGEGGRGHEKTLGNGGGFRVSGSRDARSFVCGKIWRDVGGRGPSGGTGATACNSEAILCCQFRLASCMSGVEVFFAVV